ncbi:hypothetical protein [Desulfuribacillus stibiiarsenatis]|nr:hypothetical protein [Desulfuribacillus stibiiarsenatis]
MKILTSEENDKILFSVLIPYIIEKLEKDKILLEETSALKFGKAYLELLDSVISASSKERSQYRIFMRENNIRIVDSKICSDGVYIGVKYNGYLFRHHYDRYVIRNRVNEYVNQKVSASSF